MNAKEIGRRAGRIFSYQLPSHWIERSQEDQEDYGIDAEIEIATSGDNATGFIFKAQIKGQENVSVIKKGKYISFDLSLNRLAYYIDEINIPVILFIVDIKNEIIYWDNLKENSKAIRDLRQAQKAQQKTVAVHSKAENTLKGKYESLLASINRSIGVMRINSLDKISADIKKILPTSEEMDLENLLRNAKLINFEIYNEQLERLLSSGDYSNLYQKADLIYKSATELIETRFSAAAYIEKVIQADTLDDSKKQDLLVNLYINMLLLTRRQPEKHLRIYAVLLIRSIFLRQLVNIDHHHSITNKIMQNDPIVKLFTSIHSSKLQLIVAELASKTIFKLNYCLRRGLIDMFLEIFTRLAPSLTIYSNRLKNDGLIKNHDMISKWMLFCIDLLLEYGKKNNSDYILSRCAQYFATISAAESEVKIDLAKSFEVVELIKDIDTKNNVIRFLENLEKIKSESNNPAPDQELKFFKDRAISLGIDVNNPNDEIGKIIHQGLLDYNPERIIKDCEHMVYIPSASLGVPARMVGLPSAGMKHLYCLKGKGAISGWSLDNIYSFGNSNLGFKEKFCKDCIDKKPRDDSWKWSSKWQAQITIEHKEIFETFMKI